MDVIYFMYFNMKERCNFTTINKNEGLTKHALTVKKLNELILVKNYNYRVEKFLKTSMARALLYKFYLNPLTQKSLTKVLVSL